MSLNCHSKVIKLALSRHCEGAFFMLFFTYKGVDFMSLSNYIKNHNVLKQYDFIVVYGIIIELLKDGKMEWDIKDV
jgi:hypothetical protein